MLLSRTYFLLQSVRRFATFFSKDHEWVTVADGSKVGIVGITNHAQELLGDVVHVELPEIGDKFAAGEVVGSVESVKTVADVYLPVTGSVQETNSELKEKPELLNESPEDAAWMMKIEISDIKDLDALMSKESYDKFLESQA